eukprot:266371-Rhodomonas_salina.1
MCRHFKPVFEASGPWIGVHLLGALSLVQSQLKIYLRIYNGSNEGFDVPVGEHWRAASGH